MGGAELSNSGVYGATLAAGHTATTTEPTNNVRCEYPGTFLGSTLVAQLIVESGGTVNFDNASMSRLEESNQRGKGGGFTDCAFRHLQ